MRRHKRYHHNDQKVIKSEKKYFCSVCKNCFTGAAVLKNHFTLHHSGIEPQIPCPMEECKEFFVTPQQLKSHLGKIHRPQKKLCTECGIVVLDNTSLKKHIRRMHLKEKNFHCDYCGYQGFTKTNLTNHVCLLELSIIAFVI
jgi:KRAB domain-containing zinc finger protein